MTSKFIPGIDVWVQHNKHGWLFGNLIGKEGIGWKLNTDFGELCVKVCLVQISFFFVNYLNDHLIGLC
jgi:hypothetical protein